MQYFLENTHARFKCLYSKSMWKTCDKHFIAKNKSNIDENVTKNDCILTFTIILALTEWYTL